MAAEKFLEKVGTQSLGTYIEGRQATVTEWVALRPILEVCVRETGYEWGREAPGAAVEANGGQKAAECYVK